METANIFLQRMREQRQPGRTSVQRPPQSGRQSQPPAQQPIPTKQLPSPQQQRPLSTPTTVSYPTYSPDNYGQPPYSPTSPTVSNHSSLAAAKAYETSPTSLPYPAQGGHVQQYPPRTDSAAAAAAAYGAAQTQPAQTYPYQPQPAYDPRLPQSQQPQHHQQYAATSGPLRDPFEPVYPQQKPSTMAEQEPAPQEHPHRQSYTMQVPPGRQTIIPVQQPPAQKPQKIGLDHFNFLAVLGKGNFGKVMLAETKASKKLYAIKVLKKEFIIENDEVESMKSEKRVFLIANKARHPFLLNLHACFQTETRVYFVMEYVSGGDLMLHIQREQFGTKRAQ